MPEAAYWAPRAWLPEGWRDHVLLQTDGAGCWTAITADVPVPPAGVQRLAGPVLPGLVNAHSHAFQRAFAGLAETRDSPADDFWSWRSRMYRVALRITPEQLRAVAAHLFVELLRGGYTHVCEFHYLEHAPGGQPYADPLALAWAIADAAADAGIGLTLLPAVYERAGFTEPALHADQCRFRASTVDVLRAASALENARRPLLSAGIAIHSLRAATADSVRLIAEAAAAGPIHVHVSEQAAEVDGCLAAYGARPVAWLAREVRLDPRWHLVHALHTTPAEIEAVASSGAGIVLCPATEANLGDGLTDLHGWLAAGVPAAIGSDSHVTRDWREELRWLEYGQRLVRRQRNVAAAPQAGLPATAERLWATALRAGASAAGLGTAGLIAGARADLLVADPEDPALLGIPDPHWLGALVFSSPARPWRDVMVAGRWVVRDGHHGRAEAIGRRFADAMGELWSGTRGDG